MRIVDTYIDCVIPAEMTSTLCILRVPIEYEVQTKFNITDEYFSHDLALSISSILHRLIALVL